MLVRHCLPLVLLLICGLARADDRAQALAGLDDPATEHRAAAVIWFAQNGTPADDKLILPRLGDDDPMVRRLAESGMWILWSRSGDAAIDALMARGARELEARDLAAAIATYSVIKLVSAEILEIMNKVIDPRKKQTFENERSFLFTTLRLPKNNIDRDDGLSFPRE